MLMGSQTRCCATWWTDTSTASNPTCVDTQQPGADERRQRLAGLGQQGHHPEEERRGRLLAPVHHKVLVHQVGDDQFEQPARPLGEDPVTGRHTSTASSTEAAGGERRRTEQRCLPRLPPGVGLQSHQHHPCEASSCVSTIRTPGDGSSSAWLKGSDSHQVVFPHVFK